LFFLIKNNDSYDYFYKTFVLLAILKSITQIVLFVAIVFVGIPSLLIEEIFDINHGMIYPDGFWLHIAVRGTPFLVLAFMLRFARTLKLDIINIILFFGVLSAGNFAYLLGLFFSITYCIIIKFIIKNKYWYIYNVLLILLFSIVIVVIMPYASRQYELKKTFSNAKRIDQAKILLTTGNAISGNGFGVSIRAVTRFQDYTDNVYFELQTLYVINQIGLIGYCLFMICTIYIFCSRNKQMFPFYLIYLLYSFWNPYCFDTTHMVAAFLLVGNRKMA
jgi:hypothetical protein